MQTIEIGNMYRSVHIERVFIIIGESELTLTLCTYPPYSTSIVSKSEFLSTIKQNKLEFIERISDNDIRQLKPLEPKYQFYKAYEDYNRRKQSIIQSELLDSGIQE